MNTYNTHRLGCGLRVIHLPTQGEVVYCGYAVNAGSRHEQPGEEGLAHFCEHMAFKGTQRRTSIQVINTLERVGGELNAYTAKEETVYYAAVLKQHFSRAVDLLTDILLHSRYPQEEIEKEVEVVCDEIDSYRDSPADLIYDEFENLLFGGTPLGHNVLGTKSSVRSFTTADCLRFTRREYRPERMVFYVVGDVDFDRLLRQLNQQDFATQAEKLSESIAKEAIKADDTTEKDRYHQAHVMLGTACCDDIETWRMPLYIVNNILGGPAMNSRFNLSLRERRGLVYTVEGLLTTYSDALMWSVYFGSDKEDAKRCQRLIESELNRLRKRPMSVAALNAAKRQLKGQVALASENKESFAIDMAKQYLHRGTLRSNTELFRRIDAVTPADIHRLMTTVLSQPSLKLLRL